MTNKDPEKARAWMLAWINRRRQDWITENGPCAKCGSGEQLEIDHIDPALKSMQPSHLWTRRKEIRDLELAKCQVLCKACHAAKTFAGLGLCGVASRYEKGCRCDECRAAHAKKNREWRQRRKAR